jgi:tetratricopeptide (TPR) repeat protein
MAGRLHRWNTVLLPLVLLWASATAGFVDWFNKGVEHLKAREYDQAIGAFTTALEIMPYDHEALNNRGIAWSRKRAYQRALEDFDAALALNPDYHFAYLNRGIVWQKKRDHHRAIADYARALEINPANTQTHMILAWILATCPDAAYRDGPAALALLRKAEALAPQTDLQDVAAAIHAENGQFEKAVALEQRHLDKLEGGAGNAQLEVHRKRLKLYRRKRPYREQYPVALHARAQEASLLMARVRALAALQARPVSASAPEATDAETADISSAARSMPAAAEGVGSSLVPLRQDATAAALQGAVVLGRPRSVASDRPDDESRVEMLPAAGPARPSPPLAGPASRISIGKLKTYDSGVVPPEWRSFFGKRL